MEKLLISACLTGVNCKYSGGNNALPEAVLERLRGEYELIAVCPESDGGLPTPREPSERRGNRVVSRVGVDVTAEFKKGAEIALEAALKNGCRKALLKAKSPSCGKDMIYDGTFTGTLTAGDGVTVELLKANNIQVISENEIE